MQEMKDFKKSKTKTSKTKTPKYLLRKPCFHLQFHNSCSLERNCLITASKNSENITVQLLSSFGNCPVYIVWLKTPIIITKMWTFSLSSRLFASAECLKSVKNARNEGFQEVEN